MIRLGWRLAVRGGRDAVVRLVLTASAVGLGVAMLLVTLAGINAVNKQNGRYAWVETGAVSTHTAPVPGVDPLWWALTADEFHGEVVGRVDVAATGPNSPVPPGLARLPRAGEYFVSPALDRLLTTSPSDELAARYPGREAGLIGKAGLPSPDSLVVVVGRTPAQVSALSDATEVDRISTTPPNACNGACVYVGIDAKGMDLILSIVAAAMLFPVLAFIGTATRLSAARREQRFAAMRLVGATPRQVAVVSAVEAAVAAVMGVAIGFAVFFLVRAPLTDVPFTGSRFYLSDLSLSAVDVLAVAFGVPVAGAVAARIALHRVNISPLGITRRVTPRPVRPWRVLPLLAGLAELGWFVVAGRPATTQGQVCAYLTGILVTMTGLLLAGPWLLSVGSRLLARRTGRPAVLIAARRISDDPRGGFRAIGGLVLALFVTSVAVGVISTIDAYEGGSHTTAAQRGTVVDDFTVYGPGGPRTSVQAVSPGLSAALVRTPGVVGVAVVHANPDGRPSRVGPADAIVSCAELAATPALGRCAPGATAGYLDLAFDVRSNSAPRRLAAAPFTADQIASSPPRALVVATNGSRAAIERVRTQLENAYPAQHEFQPLTIGELLAQNGNVQRDAQYRRLADLAMITSLVIAGCSLAVSVVTALNDRRRPFSMLRLTGTPLAVLRRVVGWETVVPLVAVSALSVGVAFTAAGLFASSQLSEQLQAPGAGYYGIVAAGLAASFAVIAATLPVLERITGPESARNE